MDNSQPCKMIDLEKLEENFYPVKALNDKFIRCADELQDRNIYTYFGLRQKKGNDVIIVSDTIADDEFALSIFNHSPLDLRSGIAKHPLPENAYKFTHSIYADHTYFSDLNGRLDAEKANTIIAIPIFESEFSGDESSEDFYLLKRNVVPTNDWNRKPQPKILLRFDNTKTGSGTGDGYVFAKFDLLMREIHEMVGSFDSFIELINFRHQVMEILYNHQDGYQVIYNRDDNEVYGMPVSDLENVVSSFVS